NGQTTSSQAFNASAASVQSALEALSTIGTGNVLVTRSGNVFTVTFQNVRGRFNQPPLSGIGTGGASLSFATTQNGGSSIVADVTNNGTINLGGSGAAGQLNVTGTYTQSSTGVLNVEIAGTAAGSQFDQLAISGAATLDGTLNVTDINNFLEGKGHSFQALTYASVGAGDFATKNLPALLVAQKNATNYTLTQTTSVVTWDGEAGDNNW